MKWTQTEETHTVIRTKIPKVLMNHQSDHVMSSVLLLLTALQGVPGLFKYVLLLFPSLQLTHWDKLHRSTGDSAEQPVPTWADSYCSVSKSSEESQQSWKEKGEKARYSTETGHDIININRGDTVEETQGLHRLSREVVSQFCSSTLALFVNYMQSNYTRKELLI